MLGCSDERARSGESAEAQLPEERPISGGFYVALADLGAEMDPVERLRRRVMASLRGIATRLEEGANNTARRHGIHVTDLYVLLILYHANPEHVGRPAVIQRALGFTAGGMTRRVDSMVARDLARRLPDPSDGRALLLQLTGKGAALAAVIHADPDTRGPIRTTNLSAAEWQVLGDLLDRIAAPPRAPA